MILEQTYGNYYGDNHLQESHQYTGDASELIGIVTDLLTETHNLTIALARFEHKCLTESGDSTYLMEAGVKEFLAGVIASIRKGFSTFIGWIRAAITKLKLSFSKRESWLKSNKAAILAKTNAALQGLTVTVGDVVAKGDYDYSTVISHTTDVCLELVDTAVKAPIGWSKLNLIKQTEMLFTRAMGKTPIPAKAMVGSSEKELALNAPIVAKAVTKAEQTFEAVSQLDGGKKVADQAVAEAERAAGTTAGGDSKLVSERLNLILAITPKIVTIFHELGTALNTANGQFMSICVKAASAKSDKPSADAENKDSGSDQSEVQNNSGNLLAAFM